MKLHLLKWTSLYLALEFVDKNNLAFVYDSVVYDGAGCFVLILKTDSYPQYWYIAKKLDWDIMSTAEYTN